MMKHSKAKQLTYKVDGEESFAHLFAKMDVAAVTETHVLEPELETSQKRCLISKEVLDWTAVRLNCGHAFNYDPLFSEMVAHRGKHGNKYSSMYHTKVDSSTNENCKYSIICPYCRTVTPHTLPAKDGEDGSPVIEKKGVNAPTKYAHSDFRCSHMINNGKSSTTTKQCPKMGIIFPVGVYCAVHRRTLRKAQEKAEAKAKRAEELAQKRAEAKAKRAEAKAKKEEKKEKKEMQKKAKPTKASHSKQSENSH